MPKRATVSETDLAWLHQNANTHINDIAARLQVCSDTARRILVRLGIRNYPGAKYVPTAPPQTWRKPCLRCGDIEERPKGLFLCNDCRRFASENHSSFET